MKSLAARNTEGTLLDGMGASLMALLIGLALSLCLAPCALAFHGDAGQPVDVPPKPHASALR